MTEAPRHIPVAHASAQDLQDICSFTQTLKERNLFSLGCVKVIPPTSWQPSKCAPDAFLKNKKIYVAKQVFQPHTVNGPYIYISSHKRKSYASFKRTAEARMPAPNLTNDQDHYWKSFYSSSIEYGADNHWSLMNPEVFSVGGSVLNCLLNDIPGVTTPFSYIGMYGATFVWHKEDADLYSCNYHHFGMPKTWCIIPPHETRKFEDLLHSIHQVEYEKYRGHCWHKCYTVHPHLILDHGVECISVNFKIPFVFICAGGPSYSGVF